MRDLLVVPLELAAVGVEGEHRGRIEVVAWPRAAPVVVRRGIGGAPVDKIQRRIERAGHPAAAAAELTGVAAPALRVVLDRVELPGLLTGGRHERVDLALDRELAGRLSENDLVLHDQRGAGEVAAALLRVEDLLLPRHLSGLLVERDHAPVEAAEEDLAVPDTDAAVVGLEEQRVHHGIELGIVVPDLLARRRVEREYAVVGGDVVHDAVDDDRRRLQALHDGAGLVHPRHGQGLDVVLVDLAQRTEAEPIIGPVVHGPVVRIFVLQPTQTRRLARSERGGDAEREQHEQQRGATNGQPLPHEGSPLDSTLGTALDPTRTAAYVNSPSSAAVKRPCRNATAGDRARRVRVRRVAAPRSRVVAAVNNAVKVRGVR